KFRRTSGPGQVIGVGMATFHEQVIIPDIVICEEACCNQKIEWQSHEVDCKRTQTPRTWPIGRTGHLLCDASGKKLVAPSASKGQAFVQRMNHVTRKTASSLHPR